MHAREKERKRVPLIKVDKREMSTDIKSDYDKAVTDGDNKQVKVEYAK